MLTFLTLLLGIVWGPREIELSAPAGTATLEILIDGERAALRHEPPWTFAVDFGSAPAPHHLDAVARDARGAELARVRQRVNLPHPAVGAVLALLPGEGGTGRAVRLAWEGPVGPTPSKVTVTFDGKPLMVPDPARIELPPFVPERLHFLRAVVEFGRSARVEAEITFGGVSRDESSRELTAVLLRVPRGIHPAPDEMSGWLAVDGTPLRVVAIEEGDASIVFVLDAGVQAAFERMGRGALFDGRTGFFKGEPEVRTLSAYPEKQPGSRSIFDVYWRSFPAPVVRGMMAVLAEAYTPWDRLSCPHFADAAFAAGIVAASWSHPRAVVLVLTGNRDASILPAAYARSFLGSLGVPLFVWTAGPADPDAAMEWGEGLAVKTRADLRAAVLALELAVDEQRIVWVEGAHLPQSIFVSAAAPAGVTVAR